MTVEKANFCAAVAALGLLWPGQTAAVAQGNCKELKGELVVLPQSGTTRNYQKWR